MRKGQAAMEFLMTYGWAILVVLIAIGALAYFGVLNPARFLPNSCTLFPGLACTEFKVDDNPLGSAFGRIDLYIRNGIGDSMAITRVEFTTAGAACENTSLKFGAAATNSLGDGAEGLISVRNTALNTPCAIPSSPGRFKSDIQMDYTIGTGGLSHTRTGAIVAQVE